VARIVIQLSRQEGADNDECEQFLRCFYDRVEKGPPEHRESGEAEQRQVDASDPVQEVAITAETAQAAKRKAEEAAAACNPGWHDLYGIGPVGE
jgi:hypothetical protein